MGRLKWDIDKKENNKIMVASFISAIIGFFSALLIFSMFFIVIWKDVPDLKNKDDSMVFVIVLLVVLGGSWFASSMLLANQTKSISKIISRGFLLWASEWLFFIFIIIMKFLIDLFSLYQNKSSNVENLFNLTFGGISFITTVGFCFLMSAACMLGYGITRFFMIEMKAEESVKDCAYCCESVKSEAINCRFCGAKFSG